ncbi:MAG TPA: polysaccharide lyase, partial [Halioglobus sp.]
LALFIALPVVAEGSPPASSPEGQHFPAGKPSSVATAKLVFVSDFETGAIQPRAANPDGWEEVNGGLPNATVVVGPEVQSPRSGKFCVQFNLVKGDWNGVNARPGERGKPRAQLKKSPRIFPYLQGVEYWIGISTFHPSDWQFDSNANNQIVFWQMHGHGGPQGKSPPLALRLGGTSLTIVNRSGDAHGPSFKTDELWKGSMILNQWVDWIVRVRFEQTGTEGYVQVWRNGELIASKLNAPTLYYTNKPDPVRDVAYQLLSSYKGKWIAEASSVTSHTFYYDSIRIAVGANGKALIDPANYH